MAQDTQNLWPRRAPPRDAGALTADEQKNIKELFELKFSRALENDVTPKEKLDLCTCLRGAIDRLWKSNSNYFGDASQTIATASRNGCYDLESAPHMIYNETNTYLQKHGGLRLESVAS